MKNILIGILSVICVVLLYILTTILYIAYNRPIIEKLGQTGDFIGGMLNPIFAFLSFALLCFAILLFCNVKSWHTVLRNFKPQEMS